jgi:hypothetical protein
LPPEPVVESCHDAEKGLGECEADAAAEPGLGLSPGLPPPGDKFPGDEAPDDKSKNESDIRREGGASTSRICS